MTQIVNFKLADVEKACKESFNFLAALALPETCVVGFPLVYLNIHSMLMEAMERVRDFSQLALGLPRGHAKTTYLKIIIIAIILFTKKRFVLVVCAKEDLAINILTDVEAILDSMNIVRTFGNWRDNISKKTQDTKVFFFRGRKIILHGMGAESAIRGANIDNQRPDVILMDDMQTKENAENENSARKLQQWMAGTLMKAKSPNGCTFIYCGNMYRDIKIGGTTGTHYTCILRNLQRNPSWRSIIVGAILQDGSALWEEVQPKQQLLQELQNDILMGCPEVFYSEVLNDPQCGNGQHFDLSKLPPYKTDPSIDFMTGKFIIIDPSLGKKKSDAQIVGVVEVYDGVPELAQIHVRQTSAPDLVDWVLNLAVAENIPLIIGESVAYQATLLQWFNHFATERNITGKKFEPVSPGGRTKNGRIVSSFKSLMNGRWRVQPKCLAMYLSQVQNFDILKTNNVDDILDMAAYIDDIMLLYPNEMILQHIFNMNFGADFEVVEDNNVF